LHRSLAKSRQLTAEQNPFPPRGHMCSFILFYYEPKSAVRQDYKDYISFLKHGFIHHFSAFIRFPFPLSEQRFFQAHIHKLNL